MSNRIVFVCIAALLSVIARAQNPEIYKEKRGENFIYGLKDSSGKIILPAKYDAIEPFSEGLAQVKLNWKRGYINADGKEIVVPKYSETGDFVNGFAVVFNEKGGGGYINKKGKEICPLIYESLNSFIDGRAVVTQGLKAGMIDTTGKLIAACKYEWVETRQMSGKKGYNFETVFLAGLAKIMINSKFGLIDKRFKEIVAPKYDGIGYFSEGLAVVALKDKLGFIDTTGTLVIPMIFDHDGFSFFHGSGPKFKDGKVKVNISGKPVYIDKKGSVITSF